jgi:diketogulonate reductase-like aldo/keto reductase
MSERLRSRQFGPLAHPVPVVGQGTWRMEHDRAPAVRALRAGLDLGATHIDTAEMYGDGAVEELVGEAIAGRRDEVFLVSKVMPQHASRRGTRAACESSLRRLRTARLDLYLLHWPGSQPLEETITAFEDLVAEGSIAAWGLSNFDEDELAEALSIAGPGRIACNQVLYHLRERAVEHAVVPFCAEHGIALVAYSPYGQAGGFPDPAGAGGQALAEVAQACGARAGRPVSPRQVALAFLLRHEHAFVIPKAAQAAHVAENAASHDLRLDADSIARLETAFPVGPRRRGVPML